MGKRNKKIMDLVLQKKQVIIDDAAEALANKKLAIAAITGGVGSQAWKTYMKQFVSNDDAEQLNRLTAMDNTRGDQAMIDRRAYLVANGVCGEGTRQRFQENVDTIDAGIEIVSEPTT